MVTLESAENALKQAYLTVLQNQLNTNIDPVLGKIAQTTSDVWGKEIIVNCSFVDNHYITAKSELKNIYGKIEISDKAIRVSQYSAGAFVDLLNSEMENLIKETCYRITNAFYGEDKAPEYLPKEIKKQYVPLKLSGLKELFDNTQETLYGVNRNEFNFKPKEAKIVAFDYDKLQALIDIYNPNFIICNPSWKRKYQKYCENNKENIEFAEFNGGYKCILFNKEIPIQTNAQIPDNVLYLINTDDFKIHQLCDWLWIEDENNKIIRLNPNKPVYEANLVKYCDIICEHPEKQIKVNLCLTATQYLDYMINNLNNNNEIIDVALSQAAYELFKTYNLIKDNVFYHIVDDFDSVEYYNLEKTIKCHKNLFNKED